MTDRSQLPSESEPRHCRVLSRRESEAGIGILELALDRPIRFRPLQSVSLHGSDGRERTLPILSDPARAERLEVAWFAPGGERPAPPAPPEGSCTLRGPFGNGVDPEALRRRDVLLAGAGEGSAVLLSLARLRAAAGPGPPGTTALFGAPRVQDLPFRSELAGLSAAGRLSVRLAVERPEPGWTGAVGVVPVLFRGLTLDPPATAAIVAGPDALCKFVVLELLLRGVAEEAILVVPERGPRCGADACPECERGDRYVCRRGPVFPWPEFRESPAPR